MYWEDECETEFFVYEIAFPLGCNEIDDDESDVISCTDDSITYTYHESDDCSGPAEETEEYDDGRCYNGTVFEIYECGANEIGVTLTAFIIVLAQLFQ